MPNVLTALFPMGFLLFSLLCLAFFGKKARSTPPRRRFLTYYWILCWTLACGAAFSAWHSQHQWLNLEARHRADGRFSYFERAGSDGFQALHYQMLWQMVMYAFFFLVAPFVLYLGDRRRERLAFPTTTPA